MIEASSPSGDTWELADDWKSSDATKKSLEPRHDIDHVATILRVRGCVGEQVRRVTYVVFLFVIDDHDLTSFRRGKGEGTLRIAQRPV